MLVFFLGALQGASAQTASAGGSWVQQTTATSPATRNLGAMAYNSASSQIVLFGGFEFGAAAADTWTYNGTTWTQQTPALSPSARYRASMVYDAATNTEVLFGGYNGSTYLNDTWTYNGSTWTQINAGSPPSTRGYSMMAYDASLGKVVLFGGFNGSTTFNDTYTFDGANWTKQSPATSPPARYLGNMVYDVALGQDVIFGGQNSSNVQYADTWTYGNGNWAQLHPATSPPVRSGATMSYNSISGQVVLFGGENISGNGTALGDTWNFSGTNWTQLTLATSPAARYFSVSAFDVATGQVVLFGGTNNAADTWNLAASAPYLPNTPVGTAAAQTSVYFTIGTAGTLPALSNANVLTTGITGLDFTLGTGSTCTGAVTAKQVCTVNVVFTPAAPGLRKGAVQLLNSSGAIIAFSYLSATGTGPLADFSVVTPTNFVTAPTIPSGVTADAAGNLYITNTTQIAKANAGSNTATRYASSSVNCQLADVAIDGGGTLYATCPGHFFKVVGTNFAEPVVGSFTTPAGVVVDGSGNAFFADSGTNIVYEVAPGGTTATTVIASGAGLSKPSGLALDNAGGFYIADSGNNLIKHVAAGATVPTITATTGFTLNNPLSVAVDAAGNLFIDDYGNGRILELPAGGGAPFALGSGLGTGFGMYYMALDNQGRLFVSNEAGPYVARFDRTTASLAFPSTGVNNSSAAQTVQLENDGNSPLSFSVPASGVDPAIAGPYALGTSGTCPQISSNGTPQTLAPGNSCTDAITFQPTSASSSNPGSLTTSDNSNNAASTQVVTFSGTSTLNPQTITFPQPPAPAYTGASATLTATASSGLPVTYTVTSGPATLSGSVVTYTGPGTVVIAANQAGNGQYAAAPTVSDTITVTTASSYTAPNASVGTAAAQTSVYFNIVTAGTLPALSNSNVLTTGITGLDFTLGTGSTCTGAETAGQVCKVNVVFTPAAPGLRKGAVILLNSSGTILATAYISGTGTAPLVDFSTSTATAVVTSGLSGPQDVAVDAAGNLYMTSTTSIARSPAGSASASPYVTSSQFQGLAEVAIDGAGMLYATDNSGKKVFKIVGSAVSQLVTTALSAPQGIAVDAAGNVFFTDQGSFILYEVPAGASSPTTIIPSSGGLSYPTAVALDNNGGLYVADAGNNLVKHVAAGATTTTTVATPGFTLSSPEGLAVDAAGNLYINDLGNSRILEVPASGAAPLVLGTGSFSYFMSLDSAGRLYVADRYNNRIVRFDRTTATPVSFPSTAVGATSSAQNVMQENDGNAPLTFLVPASGINPAVAGPYVLGTGGTCPQVSANGTTQTLAPGTSCTDSIAFQPTSANASNPGTLTTTDNSNSASSTQVVTLSGTATKGAQTITFPQPNPAQAGTTATLSATSSAGLTVTFSVTSGPATISGTTITYTGTGTVVIAANQSGSANYNAAPTVSDSVTVITRFAYVAPTEPVGTKSATQTATVTITTAGKPAQINVLTTGQPNLDFAFVTGGTCSTATTYAVNATCTVNYTFQPLHPGARMGGITLTTSAGVLLGNDYLVGQGTGPQVTFPNQLAGAVLGSGFQTPFGVAVDASGNVFVTDVSTNLVQEIVAAGGYTTVKTLASGTTFSPSGIAVDGSGNVFVSNPNTNLVQEILAAGGYTTVKTLAGQYNQPSALAVDGGGNVFVADTVNNQVKEILATGGYTTVNVLASGLSNVSGLAIDASDNIFTTDNSSTPVKELTAASGYMTVNSLGSGFTYPLGIAVDPSGNVFVGDFQAGVVDEIVAAGGYTTVNTLGSGIANPAFLALDGSGNVYLTDYGNAVVKQLNFATPPTVNFPTSTNVGTVDSIDGTQVVTLTNDGTNTLSISSIAPSTASYTFTGAASSSPFPGTAPCGTSLAASAFCSIGVTFTPQTGGANNANGNIADNNLNAANATQTVTLTGTSIYAQPTITAISPAAGPAGGGTSVTVTGTNLTGITSVKFGTAAASSFTLVSATSLTAVSPAGTGTVDITVTNPSYTSATGTANQFRYQVYGSLRVSSFPSGSPSGVAQSVTVTALDTTGATYLSYTGTVTFSSSDAAATLPASYTFTAADQGTHTFQVTLNTGGTQSLTLSGGAQTVTQTGIVTTGYVWLVDGPGRLSKLYGNGSAISSSAGYTGGGTPTNGLAFDSSSNAWSLNRANNSLVEFSRTGTASSSSPYTGGGLNSPNLLAIDGKGQVWITNNSGSLSLFSNNGTALSPTSGFTGVTSAGTGYAVPTGIAIDASGNLWVANSSDNTLTEVLGGAAPVAPLSTALTNNTTGARP